MIVEQLYLGCLSQASYFVGDEATKTAAVVDPRRDIEPYLSEAEARGMRIKHVFLTHFHADFISGHLELAEKTGATIYLGAAAETEYEATGLADGDTVEFGGVRLTALATPGHTPESTCYLIHDLAAGAAEPHGVFTGDTLFVGDVGRPDLMASVGVTREELAGALYRSLHEKILPLPDATVVYPGHGAGSACGKNLSSETTSTIGAQRAENYALQPMTEAEFVALVAADQPPAPAYFAYDAALNKRLRPTLDEALARAGTALDPGEVARLEAEEGAQVLDVRSPETFASGHRPGSFSVGIDGRFAGWAGAVLDPARPVVLVADPGREGEAATRLGRVGIDKVLGFVDGGSFGLGGELDSFERFGPQVLEDRLAEKKPPLVLDVRGPGERAGGYIGEDSLHIPLPELPGRVDEVPRDRDVVVHCAGGYRSVIAVSLLMRAGLDRVADLRGGMKAWRQAELPEVVPAGGGTCPVSG